MNIFSDDIWTVGTADQDGQPIMVRVRGEVPDAARRHGLTQLIVVGWPYDGVETGLPGAADAASMQAFEDAIAVGLERTGVGVAVASLTGAGHREWRYYAADADAFVAALNAALEDHPTYPLEIEMFDDPAWEGLQQLLDGLDEDAGDDGDDAEDGDEAAGVDDPDDPEGDRDA